MRKGASALAGAAARDRPRSASGSRMANRPAHGKRFRNGTAAAPGLGVGAAASRQETQGLGQRGE
ncbi:MAG TPA: hypothetical protein VFX03_11135, partial [Thermomicrobiales bacterium]|nr:hypothetical protein [Thermomicrobiales bacterium]